MTKQKDKAKGQTVTLKSTSPKRDYIIASDGTRFRKGKPVENVSQEIVDELNNQKGVTIDIGESDSDGGSDDNDTGDGGGESPLHSGEDQPGPGGEVTT